MSGAVVNSPLESLKETKKGKLNYDYPWEGYSPSEKMALLSVLALPPAFSPEAVDLLTKKVARLSFKCSSLDDEDDGGSVTTALEAIPESPPHTSTPNLTVATTGTDFPMETRRKTLSRAQALEEEENPEESQDDLLMHETEEAISLGRRLFKKSHDRSINLTYTLSQAGEFPGFNEVSVVEQSRQELKEYSVDKDRELEEEVEKQVMARKDQFQEQLEEIREEKQRQYECQRALRAAERRREKEEEVNREREHQQAARKRMEVLRARYQVQEELIQAKLRLGEEKKQEVLKRIEAELRRKEALKLKLLNDCRQFREQAAKTSAQFSMFYTSCRYPHLLPHTITDKYNSVLTEIASVQVSLASQEASGSPDEATIGKLRSHLTAFLPLLTEVKSAVEEANERGEQGKLLEAAAKKLEEEEKGREEGKAKGTPEGSNKEEVLKAGEAAKKEPVDSSFAGESALSACIPTSMLSVYDRLQENMSKTIDLYGDLASSKDPHLKKYRFDLQKVITSTVNAISPQSGEHLLEVTAKLRRVLSGQQVEVTGRSLSINQHPHAKLYCSNLLAKKIVKQGEEQVASQGDSAFPIAAVTVGIWSDFPEVGELILAHFHSSCPALVPFYIPRGKDMTEADHMRLQGYKVSSSGAVESEDMYLKRMTGITRLYAAIVQTPCLHPSKPHPHGLEHGWAWLARVLNMEPQPSITATLLYDFLENAGHALMKKYGRQFQKLLFILCKEYILKIEKVTPQAQQGPLSRLSQFLEQCVTSGRIPEPKGCLTPGFWRTRSQGIAVA